MNKDRHYCQLRLLYRIKSKAAITLTFYLHCTAIAALSFIVYRCPNVEGIANKDAYELKHKVP